MRISDWSSDVCSSDLQFLEAEQAVSLLRCVDGLSSAHSMNIMCLCGNNELVSQVVVTGVLEGSQASDFERYVLGARILAVNDFAISNLDDFGQKVNTAVTSGQDMVLSFIPRFVSVPGVDRSEAHTSELQSLMRNSYAVFCLIHNSQ